MSIRIARALPLILALAACSTTTQRVERLAAFERDPHSSFARNVMMASGRPMIRDGVGPAGGGFTGRQDGGSVATIGAGALAGNVGLGVGLGLLRGLEGRGYDPGTRNMVVAWMPADMAVNGVDARNKINELAASAFFDALNSHGIQFEAEIFDVDLSKEVADIPVAFRVGIEGCNPMCGPHTIGTSRPLAKIETPPFIGTGSAYASLAHRDYGTTNWWRISSGVSNDNLGTDELNIYKEMSRNLPNWAFIYLAPNFWVSCMTDGCKQRNYPVLLHQGDIHYFTRPGTDVANAE